MSLRWEFLGHDKVMAALAVIAHGQQRGGVLCQCRLFLKHFTVKEVQTMVTTCWQSPLGIFPGLFI